MAGRRQLSLCYTTDPNVPADATPEQRANPSMGSWPGPTYLEQQQHRLPAHKYRRRHLNLPGSAEGAALRAESIEVCTVTGRRALLPEPGRHYVAFVDMSGGSSDDAVLAIAHHDRETGKAVLDRLMTQTGRPPFSPRDAVRKFVAMLRDYRVDRVVGDRYAGETFRGDFREAEIEYEVSRLTKSQLYEALEPKLNAGEVDLPDLPPLHEQLLGLVMKPGGKIDHAPGEHDDLVDAVAGAVYEAGSGRYAPLEIWGGGEGLRVSGR